MKRNLIAMAVAAAVSAAGMAQAGAQGVTANTITIGTHTDLSGPLAIWGVPAVNGLKMRIDEQNAAGGVHGRKIELIVEDTKYEVPQAVRATNKLVNKDGIFAMLMGTGTPQNNAAMQILDKAGVPNLFPLTGARTMFEPLSPLHFSYFVSYKDQASGALRFFHKKGAKKICLQTHANDYGQEVTEGVEMTAKELGMEIVLHGEHKTTETEFAGSATAIKNAGCDVTVLGTTVKDTITLYATLRKLGYEGDVVGNMVPYMPLVAEAGDGVTAGLYLVSPFVIADFGDGDAWRADFLSKYKDKFGADPAAQAQIGYTSADLLIQALEAAGPDLTVEALTAALEGIKGYKDKFGGPDISFGGDKHFAGDALVMVQSKDKEWLVVEENLPY